MNLTLTFFIPLLLMLVAAATIAWQVVPLTLFQVKTSHILKQADKYLASTLYERLHMNKTAFICKAIVKAEGQWVFAWRLQAGEKSRAVRKHIHATISPAPDVGSWLYRQGYRPSFNEIQAVRRKWLVELINYYESIGD